MISILLASTSRSRRNYDVNVGFDGEEVPVLERHRGGSSAAISDDEHFVAYETTLACRLPTHSRFCERVGFLGGRVPISSKSIDASVAVAIPTHRKVRDLWAPG